MRSLFLIGLILTIITLSYGEPMENITEERIEGTCGHAKPCSPGLILPVWQPQDVSGGTKAFRAFVYLIAMAYLFFGVSIIADRFMASIEVITSQEKEVKMKKITGEPYTVLIKVWNETVSNLTLMALGSSAPEILLSVIEIVGNNFEAGDLGPSTIVGSAAFNLFCIIAICIVAVPSNEIRRVHRMDVFWVTVAWSLFAYVWLFLILSVFSPNEVEVWEGVLTFLFFPLTVLTAFMTNKKTGIFGQRLLSPLSYISFRRSRTPRETAPSKKHSNIENGISDVTGTLLGTNATKEDYAAFEEHRKHHLDILRQLRNEHPDLSLEQLEKIATAKIVADAPKSRAFYRIQATHKMMGSGDLTAKLKVPEKEKESEFSRPTTPIMKPKVITVSFDPANYMCLENIGTIKVKVRCDRGSFQVPSRVRVHYKTYPDSAQEHTDYKPVEGELVFEHGEEEKEIGIEIVDNDVYEEDEQFFVRLSEPKAIMANNESQSLPIRLGAAEATVLVIDDDHGGAFTFSSETFKVAETAGVFYLNVQRHRGARGAVTLPYKVIDGSANNGKDYVAPDPSELHFEDGQTKATIEITIINDDEYEKSEDFYVELEPPIWHAKNQAGEDGADGRPLLGDHTRCRITITEDREFKGFIDKLAVNANTSLMVGTSSWKQQFTDAMTVEDIDGDGSLSVKEKVLHYVALPWKLTFALIPPTDYFNGWVCFVVCIIGIGILTAFIGDVAAMFGCTIGLKDSVTAITLVALGTSLPDAFASKTAALQDPTADSSIGNVTGSNAVNVFLGIGIAWALAAIHHAFHGTTFKVESGTLASSVTLFLIGAVICIGILQWRRRKSNVKGELGGPNGPKYLSAGIFVFVWIVYILYSSLVTYCIVPGF